MTFDTSAYCPGGTGKKIKHCMCRDISGDLQKIWQALEGNQRIAALDRIDRVLATKANRPCLLAMKIRALFEMNDLQRLEETVATFVKVAPENTLSHGFAALLEARKDQPRAAVEALQAAVSRVAGPFSAELLGAVAAVGAVLANHGDFMAAHAHMLARAMLAPDSDNAAESLMKICSVREVPLLLKRTPCFLSAPEDVPWKQSFEQAYEKCGHLAWKAGLELFESLDRAHPGQHAILENIAVTRGCLGYEGCAEAWHRCARCDSIEFEDAVRAEATAQLLEYEAARRQVAYKKVSLNVTDANAVHEKLLSSERFVPGQADPANQPEDSPPPKGVFRLIDRPSLGDDAELDVEKLPRSLAEVVLFGKETDREARVELWSSEGERLEAARRFVSELAGELLVGGSETEEIVDTQSAESVELFPVLHFPEKTSLFTRRRLINKAVAAEYQRKWPKLALTELDGKSPEEVADDPAYRVPLAAALQVVEEWAAVQGWHVDADQLRERLGVPVPPPIDPTDLDIRALEPHEWRRVEVEKLTDDELQEFYAHADMYFARRAMSRWGHELLKRDQPSEALNLAEIAGTLAELEFDPEDSIALLQRAQSIEQRAGKSPARWYLGELPLRLLQRNPAEIERLLTVLQNHHMNEPGVAEGLFEIMKRFGIVGEDGQPTAELRQTGRSDNAGATESDQKLWTPDSDQSRGDSRDSRQSSRLWIPDSGD